MLIYVPAARYMWRCDTCGASSYIDVRDKGEWQDILTKFRRLHVKLSPDCQGEDNFHFGREPIDQSISKISK